VKRLRRLPLAEQTADHLLEGMRSGRWGAALPGVNALAKEFDISRETLRTALRLLESKGLLLAGGPGRNRIITTEIPPAVSSQSLRIAILLHSPLSNENAEIHGSMLRLQQAIESAGHVCIFADEDQTRLRHDVRKIARLVAATPADAWVVLAGSKEILEWFAAQPFPSIAFGGRSIGVPIASVGTDSTGALSKAVRELIALGHRRIVMISPGQWRKPIPGRIAKVFADELASCDIAAGEYNLPDWEETPEGLQTLLSSLFHLTPPTALIVVEPAHAVAVLGFAGQRGLKIGRDISLVCMMSDPAFTWRRPSITHLAANTVPLVRRVVRWVESVARGCPDREQRDFPAEFVRGGTIGLARI
jgi:DNA-binding LacI/PurR family transcriptional regulator